MGKQTDGILSPFLRKKRIETALPFIKGKIIDIGSGVGKLSEYIKPDNYVGIDTSIEVLRIAKNKYPNHKFYTLEEYQDIKDKFDTVVALAVIEHVENPVDFVIYLRALLKQEGSIVITTPHPCSQLIHKFGSLMYFFSRSANKEHKGLINTKRMVDIAKQADVRIIRNKTFLLGTNQLFILRRG